MVRTKVIAVAALVAVGLVLAACASSDPEVSSDSTRPPGTGTTIPIGGSIMTTTPASALVTGDTLVGRTFVSTSVTGYELHAGTQITMSFTDADVTASAGCNSQGGSYTLQGGRLVVSDDLRSTMMACPEPVMAQDVWLNDFLHADPAIAATGDGISLTSGGVTVELVVQAGGTGSGSTDAASLVGPTWTTTSFVTGDSVMSLPADTEAPTFTFADDGTVAVFTGCNRGSTQYEATDGGVITWGPLATTKMACPNQNASIIETAVSTIANERATFAFDGEDLVLTGLEGAIVLRPA